MNKCRIYDEDSRACSPYYKTLSERKGKNQYHGKLYSTPADKGMQRVSDEKRPSGGETPASIKCFKCGELGHHASECKNKVLRCFKCGKTGHVLQIARVTGRLVIIVGPMVTLVLIALSRRRFKLEGKFLL